MSVDSYQFGRERINEKTGVVVGGIGGRCGRGGLGGACAEAAGGGEGTG